jgi:DNA-binding transcriptional LysR family regulator
MNLKHLPYFIAIAESGSLSAAAERLGISQPTLSKYLAGLEDELKIELFSRRKKRLFLTPAGKIYFDASRRMLDIQSQTMHNIERKLYGSDEVLVVGTSGTRGAIMLAKAYRFFAMRYPKVKLNILELNSAQQREAILNNQKSISFGGNFSLNTMPGIRYIPLMREELVLAVPIYHPLAHLADKNPNDLTSVDIEMFQDAPFALATESTELGIASERLFLNAGFSPTIVYRSAITAMITSAAKAGMGIGVILASYAEPCAELVYFRINSSPRMYLCALHKSNHTLSEMERYLLYLQILARFLLR